MKESLNTIKNKIIALIDFFYPPFKKMMDIQTFRYAAAGGSNTVFDIVLYSIAHNFILQKEIVHFGSVAISPYIAAFLITFPITFVTGFLLARYVVFPEASETKKRIQMTKYLIIVLFCIILNYVFLKFFVEVIGWWPLPAKIATTFIVVAFSYFSQKRFAFRKQST